jgi:hypothetical protein
LMCVEERDADIVSRDQELEGSRARMHESERERERARACVGMCMWIEARWFVVKKSSFW